MESKELKKIYKEYFQEKMKSSKEYKKLFSEAVECQSTYLKTVSKEEKEIIEELIGKFIEAEDQMLADTFVNAVQYSYKVFKEVSS